MLTLIVVCIVGVLWYFSNRNYARTNLWTWRRKRAAYAWAMAGAICGSYFGVAGMGSAIAGTVPGAIVGYLVASNLMKKDVDPFS